jgi:hypothetical protein
MNNKRKMKKKKKRIGQAVCTYQDLLSSLEMSQAPARDSTTLSQHSWPTEAGLTYLSVP